MYIYNQLKIGDKTLSQVEEDQKKNRSELGQITSGRPKDKSDNQKDTVKNLKNLYNSRQKIVDLLNDNSRIRSETIYKTNKKATGKGLKILTTKQMLNKCFEDYR